MKFDIFEFLETLSGNFNFITIW